MTLGRKGSTCGEIKGLTVCCFTIRAGCALHCTHTALYGSAMQSHTKQCAGADSREICIVLHTGLSPIGNNRRLPGAGGES
ncbi:unnamed protein product, partial [Staurois parvus]